MVLQIITHGELKSSIIAGVSERDIDLLILEEFIASKPFCEWFITSIGFNEAQRAEVEDAKRSVTHSTGESDLEITLISPEKDRYKLLIENKVATGFQPDQAARYRERGNSYIRHKGIKQYRSVLIAPHVYYPGSPKGFDTRMDYETLRAWFELDHTLGDRRRYKVLLLQTAIEKGRRRGHTGDDTVTRFWAAYWKLLQETAPELDMEEPDNKPAGSTFIYFQGIDLPKGVNICHKLTHGRVDLQFAGMGEKIGEIKTRFGKVLTTGIMEIAKAGKSAVIRIKVPKVSLVDSFESQSDEIIKGIEAARDLLEWYRKFGIEN